MTARDGSRNDVASARFRQAIELTPTTPSAGEYAFHAIPQSVPWPKAYGGDTVAQAAAAATATVDDTRPLHSLHSSFVRPVTVGEVVRYEVEVIRDGRGFSSRHVRGYQAERLVSMTTASFQLPEDGPEFTLEPPPASTPDLLPSSADVLAGIPGDAAEYWSRGRSFDMRHVSEPLYLSQGDTRTARQAVWVRAFERLADDPVTHRLALAYVCDYTILEPSLRALGLSWSTPGLSTASLDHSMWFHRDARVDEWLLYAQESGGVQSGRGLNLGRFFTAEGELVATVAQEGLIRA